MDGNTEQISNMVCVLVNYDGVLCNIAVLALWDVIFTALTIAKTESKHRWSQHGKRGGFTLVTIVWFSV